MDPRRQKTLAWFLLIAFAWTSVVWARGLVLCFEPDGHVTIEAAASDCSDCCSAAARQAGSREEPTLGACPCLDVALSIGSSTAVQKSKGFELQRAPLAVLEPIRWTLHGRRASASSADSPSSHGSSNQAFLRSVVLRV